MIKPNTLVATAPVVLCCAMLWTPSHCYRYYQERIPNGRRVEHSCRPNHLWYGVGHKGWQGGGALNAFGLDFKKADFVWDKCLCQLDSDGDGLTNGEELGDPDCTWTEGQAPDRITQITNPGICEPQNDLQCKAVNDFDVCAAVDFECDHLAGLDVKSMDLRLPVTAVPALKTESTWVCYSFDLPDTDAHVIAWEPIIANIDVMHHIQVFGCENENFTFPKPMSCSGMPCNRLLAMWALGTTGNCFDPSYGIRIGRHGITSFIMQFRWDNPEGRTDYYDSSGIRFYYTENPRQYDIEMMMLGQMHLNIPPGQNAHTVQGTCGSKCTESWSQTLNVVESSILMHYHGSAGNVKLYRNGQEVATLLDIPEYYYDSHNVRQFASNPVQVRPGDEIVTTCTYDTLHKKTYTHINWSPRDEFCFAWITYYPGKTGVSRSCVANGPTNKGCSAYPSTDYGGCDVDAYLASTEFTNDMASLERSCTLYGCLPGCEVAIAQLRTHHCFQPVVSGFVLYTIRGLGNAGVEFSHRFYSCDTPSSPPEDSDDDSDPRVCPTISGGGPRVVHQLVMEAICMTFMTACLLAYE